MFQDCGNSVQQDECEMFNACIYSVGLPLFYVMCNKYFDCHVNVQRPFCMLNSIHNPVMCRYFSAIRI
jgi:hypothetical protein